MIPDLTHNEKGYLIVLIATELAGLLDDFDKKLDAYDDLDEEYHSGPIDEYHRYLKILESNIVMCYDMLHKFKEEIEPGTDINTLKWPRYKYAKAIAEGYKNARG